MRPAGEVRLALIQAAREVVAELGQPGRGATLAEMVARARVETEQGVMQVSSREARYSVDNLRRSGVLQIVGERKVDYRNRPVAEYAPPSDDGVTVGAGWVDLGNCMADWVR